MRAHTLRSHFEERTSQNCVASYELRSRVAACGPRTFSAGFPPTRFAEDEVRGAGVPSSEPPQVKKAEVRQLIADLDKDAESGKINFDEFVDIMNPRMVRDLCTR